MLYIGLNSPFLWMLWNKAMHTSSSATATKCLFLFSWAQQMSHDVPSLHFGGAVYLRLIWRSKNTACSSGLLNCPRPRTPRHHLSPVCKYSPRVHPQTTSWRHCWSSRYQLGWIARWDTTPCTTAGPPVACRPLSLTPDRLAAAKAQFDSMLRESTSRRVEGPWSCASISCSRRIAAGDRV